MFCHQRPPPSRACKDGKKSTADARGLNNACMCYRAGLRLTGPTFYFTPKAMQKQARSPTKHTVNCAQVSAVYGCLVDLQQHHPFGANAACALVPLHGPYAGGAAGAARLHKGVLLRGLEQRCTRTVWPASTQLRRGYLSLRHHMLCDPRQARAASTQAAGRPGMCHSLSSTLQQGKAPRDAEQSALAREGSW